MTVLRQGSMTESSKLCVLVGQVDQKYEDGCLTTTFTVRTCASVLNIEKTLAVIVEVPVIVEILGMPSKLNT